MDREREPEKVLSLSSVEVYILTSLFEGEQHGYRIFRELRKALEGKTVIGTPTLYRLIERMAQEQLNIESDKRPDPSLGDDERRIYFRLITFGEAVLGAGWTANNMCVSHHRLLKKLQWSRMSLSEWFANSGAPHEMTGALRPFG